MTDRRDLRIFDAGLLSAIDLHATYIGLARSLGSQQAVGWLLLARSKEGHMALGASQYANMELDLDACQADGIPVVQRPLGGGTVWVDSHQLCVFFILPRHRQHQAFNRQCLTVLRILFTRLGLAVNAEDEHDIWCGGAKLLGSGGATLAGALVFGASILERFDAWSFARYAASSNDGLRRWLIELLDTRMTDLHRLGLFPNHPQLVMELAEACREAGWFLVPGMPDDVALQLIEEAVRELADPLDEGTRRRVHGGLKINHSTYLLEDAGSPWIRMIWSAGLLARVASEDAQSEAVLEKLVNHRLSSKEIIRHAESMGWSLGRASILANRVDRLLIDVEHQSAVPQS